jgi:hypothetical protein
MRRRIQVGGGRILAVMFMFGLLVPAGAQAAAPAVTNGAAANVGQSTATLTGKVDPNGSQTTYFFEYGATRLYGARTPDAPAGNGANNVNVTADIGGLAPATQYHYRLVAFNGANQVRRSGDRTFRTQRQPLGLFLNAAPNPIRPNAKTLIAGVLSGTGNGDRRIVLQANPFPYTQGFQNLTDVHLTRADGTFYFPILSQTINTQYRVVLPNAPTVASPIVAVGVAPKVSVRVKRVRRTGRGAIFRFSGGITPEHDGTQIAIQRLKRGTWVTISGTIAKHRSSKSSRYRKSVRLRRGGTFRVFSGTDDGDHVASVSRSVKLRVR